MNAIKYRTADVDGFNIFYRAAGAAGASKLLLLHGFPTAGHMFRNLIPPTGNLELADYNEGRSLLFLRERRKGK